METLKRLLWHVYASVYPVLTTSYPYREMMSVIASKVPEGARLVDVGCGPAEILAYTTSLEEYTGIDRDPWMIRLAKMAASRRRTWEAEDRRTITLCRFEEQSADEVSRWPSFDTALFSNSLYTLDEAKDLVLARVFGEMEPGGRLIVCDPAEGNSAGAVLKSHFTDYSLHHGRPRLFLHMLQILPKLVAILVINRIIFQGKAHPASTQEELYQLIEGAGFRIISQESTYAGQNLLIVAEKP